MLHQPWVEDSIRKRRRRVAVTVGRKSGRQAGHNRFSVVRISSPDCERALGLGAHCSSLDPYCGPTESERTTRSEQSCTANGSE